ncbi:hypothetical protein LIER_30492 [Lithospermum erythrorhizon]|uniref:Integrase catalytic domain-containing protein n=1 Tax=Lithospermum erythrorhizon TaxID=34254 RepID=A0AAV3RT18_LITER
MSVTGLNERESDLLRIIHTDVCGPMNTSARGGYNYFITFTDDYSRYGFVYLMRHKHESFEKFKEFQNEVQNQLNKTIKILRSDRGGEFLSHEFNTHLRECGIVSQLIPAGTPQHNGVSERRNRTLLDMVRSMMSLSDLPIPKLGFLRIWDCEAYVKRLTKDKLAPKSDKCYFIEYPKKTVGYYFYLKHENKIFIAKTGVFLEKESLFRRTRSNGVHLDEAQVDEVNVDASNAEASDAPQELAPSS